MREIRMLRSTRGDASALSPKQRNSVSEGIRNIAAIIHSITLSALEECRSSMNHTGTNIRAGCVLDRLQ